MRRVLTRCPAPKKALTPALVPVAQPRDRLVDRPMGRPVLAQQVARPWTGLLLLRLPRPVCGSSLLTPLDPGLCPGH